MEEPQQFGRFQLHELINSGGMAEIWLATDEENQHFALRRMQPVGFFDFAAKKRFVRGCEILKEVSDHPLIIGYFEHGKIDGSLYLLMEYLEGQNLKLWAAEGAPLINENISAILIDMALALEHVHDRGFMHLDFKPENVMLSRNASMRLVDFDLSKPIPKSPEKAKDNPGTPVYMAPEQLQGLPFDHRVDIFAYGVTAYELLTGQKPFPGENSGEILRKQIVRNHFLKPREVNPDIPENLENIVMKCIESDMEERYPHMSVLARDVQSALYL